MGIATALVYRAPSTHGGIATALRGRRGLPPSRPTPLRVAEARARRRRRTAGLQRSGQPSGFGSGIASSGERSWRKWSSSAGRGKRTRTWTTCRSRTCSTTSRGCCRTRSRCFGIILGGLSQWSVARTRVRYGAGEDQWLAARQEHFITVTGAPHNRHSHATVRSFRLFRRNCIAPTRVETTNEWQITRLRGLPGNPAALTTGLVHT